MTVGPWAVRSAPGSEVAQLLLVSEHDHWAEQLRADLAGEGFRVLRDRTGEGVFGGDLQIPVDAVIVDLRLRLRSGLALCAAVRARSMLPVIAVGPDSEEVSVLAAYAAGVDQYVTVDTSSRLVVARVRALLRRAPIVAEIPIEARYDAPITIDASGAVLAGGEAIRLSRREMEVLRALLARPGRVVTRTELAGAWPALSADRRLDFVIRRLRQKLEAVDGTRRINAVRGVGFRFEIDEPTVLGGPPGP